MAITAYLRDGEGLQGANLATLWAVVEYLHELNSRGVDWVWQGIGTWE